MHSVAQSRELSSVIDLQARSMDTSECFAGRSWSTAGATLVCGSELRREVRDAAMSAHFKPCLYMSEMLLDRFCGARRAKCTSLRSCVS